MIINWGEKSKKVCDASINECSNCKDISTFEIRTMEKTAGMFFVSMAKWDKKYYLVCLQCSAGFPLSEGKEDEAIKFYTELADNDTSIDIHNKIDNLFVKYIPTDEGLKNINDFITSAKENLKIEGYREKDIEWIMSVYLKHALNINKTQ